MQFSQVEKQLYLALAELLGSREAIKVFEFEGNIRAGHFSVGGDSDPISLVLSFPNSMDDCYLTATDGDPYEISKQMASLQRYNESQAHLCKMHSVKTDSHYMKDNNWVAYLITTPAMLLDELPDSIKVFDKSIRLQLAVPLNETEYQLKLNEGYDALIDYFEEEQRDIVAF